MRKNILLTFLFFVCVACSSEKTFDCRQGPIKVGIQLDNGSKVVVDAPSGSINWEKTDAIRLWAEDEKGKEVLSGVKFNLLAQNREKAYFTATLQEPMPTGRYIYSCWTPTPETQQNGILTYIVPSEQSPEELPIILFGKTEFGALEALNMNKPTGNSMAVHMSSILHYLRFFIPEGSDILGEPVEKIRFTMPYGVSGILKTSLNDGIIVDKGQTNSSTITLSNLSLKEESNNYALAAIVPSGTIYGKQDSMKVTLFGHNKYTTIKPLSLNGRDFKSGHITPVALRGRELHDLYHLHFSLKTNNLGESLQSINLYMADDSNWPGTNSSKLVWKLSPINDNYDLTIEDASLYHSLKGKNIIVEYESENAIIKETIIISANQESNTTIIDLHCPYLLYEDFSEASTEFNINGALNSKGHSANTLEGGSYGLPGWTGCQAAIIEGDGNKAMAIRHQNETYLLQGTYRGRVDSAPISAIKEGKKVKVKVTFNYTGYTNGNYTPMISYGYGQTQGAISGYYEGGSAVAKGGNLIDNIVGDKVSAPTDGTVSSINQTATFEIPECTSLTRLGWDCYGSKGKSSTTQEWVFIDNITIQIAQ